MKKEKYQTTPLPEELRKQIDEFKKKLWRLKVTEAVLAGLFGFIFSFLVILGIERLIEMPTWLRVTNLILGVSIFAIFAPLWVNKWVFKHRREQQIARLISKKFPHLGDRILGVIELEGQNQEDSHISGELRTAAMVTVTREAGRRNLSEALPQSWLSKWLFGVIGSIALVILGVFLLPQDGIISSLKRWLAPWGETERFTFTKIDEDKFKNGLIVPLNEDFTLPISLKEASRSEAEGSAKYGQEDWKKENFAGNTVIFPFSGKTKKDVVTVEIGDATAEINIIPTPRPILRKTLSEIQWPAYLERNEKSQTRLSGGTVQVLKGSELTLISHADKKLLSGSHGPVSRLAHEGEEVEGQDTTFLSTNYSFEVQTKGEQLLTGPIQIDADTLRFPLEWTDINGLRSKRPATFTIEPIEDSPPNSYIEATETEFIQLITSPINFRINGDDDFGLKSMGFHWEGTLFEVSAAKASVGNRAEYNPIAGETKEQLFTSEIIFDPEKNGITAPQTVVFQSWVEDQLPNRGPIASESKITVHFYSKEMMTAHNNAQLEALKEKIEAVIESSFENIEKSENLNHLLEKAQKDAQSSDPKIKERAEEKIEELKETAAEIAQAEAEAKEAIDAIREEAKELFQEATQDDTLEQASLKDLMKMQENLKEASEAKEKAKESFEQAEKNLEENPDTAKAEEEAKKGSEEQKKAQAALQESANKAAEAKAKGELASFVNRLKKAAKDQMSVSQIIREESQKEANQDADLQFFGESFDNITSTQKEQIHTSYNLQSKVKEDLNWIHEDISEFYSRTQKEGLDKVIKAMESIPLHEGSPDGHYTMAQITDQLLHHFESSQWFLVMGHADNFSQTIDSWAKLLDGMDGDDGGGGGGGGGDQQMSDEDFDFLMRVLRIVKKQQDIREKTRALEQQKRSLNIK